MKILVELPTWLGDSVMTTPAINNILQHYKVDCFDIIGSKQSCELFKFHPKVSNSFILSRGLNNFFTLLRPLEDYDLFISFRNSLRSRIMKILIKADMKYSYKHSKYDQTHQVEKYNSFINEISKKNFKAEDLCIYKDEKNIPIRSTKKIIGINPGASYGSAKRWYPEQFANVAYAFSGKYDIEIYGSEKELDIAKDIQTQLTNLGVKNYKNLAGKTSLTELVIKISQNSLFITGDSGPMHIAAACKIPTLALFGPTNDLETSPWKNPMSIILKKKLDCQPCLNRICKLGHHNCMKLIKSDSVIEEGIKLLEKNLD